MIRVLLVGRGPPERGGISAYMLSLQNGSLARDHEMHLLNLTRSDVPQGGRLTLRNVTRTLGDAWAVLRQARAYDIVHIHTALVPSVTMLRAALLVIATRMRRRRVIVHVHSGKVQLWLRGRAKTLAARIALGGAHRVVAVSKGAHDALRSAARPDRLVYVANGVDVTTFSRSFAPSPTDNPQPVVLYVGLLTPRKGVIDLFEASRALLEAGIRHRLVIVGGLPDEGPDAEREVRGAAPPHAELTGSLPHSEIVARYGSADVFCLPSWWEAMPLTVLEAMAAGVPVVATTVGDIPEMLAGGDAGLLVPPQRPDELAKALRTALVDPALRERLGTAGRERVEEHYTLEANTAAVRALYGELNPKARPADI